MKNPPKSKSIIHLDMDAFYPAVEVLDNPALRGKPGIVGGSMERGVVSSASYEARKFGVHSAQPMVTAIRLCPHGIVLSVRMARYRQVSGQVFEIFRRFTPLVEPLSIDEAFLDVTGCDRLFGSPVEMAKKIKQTVKEETGLTVSAGVAPSKFVAKIASDMEKPDGLTVVAPDKVGAFLDPLPISKMWGVGKKTQEALHRLNIRTFRDLRQAPVTLMERKFGKYGTKMHQLAMGIDDRDVIPHHDAKSIGHEETFSADIHDVDSARKELLSLANKVARRMRRHGVTGRTITLKVKYSDFVQITRSETLPAPTDDGPDIYSTACSLMKKTQVGRRPVRLLGVSLSQLNPFDLEKQLSFFNREEASQRKKRLHQALDTLQEKFGEGSVRPGTLIED
ncbi:MAG: DNA polymerase IV [Deltaproteobacteria bacterium]|nr:DNA polymerase IV [Deltaproteobacteria bacterium]